MKIKIFFEKFSIEKNIATNFEAPGGSGRKI